MLNNILNNFLFYSISFIGIISMVILFANIKDTLLYSQNNNYDTYDNLFKICSFIFLASFFVLWLTSYQDAYNASLAFRYFGILLALSLIISILLVLITNNDKNKKGAMLHSIKTIVFFFVVTIILYWLTI